MPKVKANKRNKPPILIVSLSAAIILLTAAWFTWVYLASERYLANVERGPAFDYPLSTDPAVIERGLYITRTRGCFGCHGQQLQGQSFEDQWEGMGVPVAPNLVKLAREYDAAMLEAAIRQGIGLNGKALYSMPSYNFVNLTDADVAAVISYLRSVPVVEATLPTPSLSWAIRYQLARGLTQHMADWADAVPPLQLGPDADPQLRRGEYIAFTSCNECHGLDLRGTTSVGSTPDLAILGGYTDEQFRTLMRKGEGIGGRTELGLMSLVAPDRFSYFTEDELEDLLAYLRTLPGQSIEVDAEWRKLR